MNSKTIRLLLCSGSVAGIVFFVADMAFCGDWGSGRSFTPDRVSNVMASVALWRLYLGSLAGPAGTWLELLAMLGLFFCCRGVAPRLATVMLASLYTFDIVGISPRGQFGPVGFALRYCGSEGAAVHHIMQLNGLMTMVASLCLFVGFGIWIFLTLSKKTGMPRWTVIFCPLIAVWLQRAMIYVPAPIGFSLVAGWKSLAFALFFAVLALTYHETKTEK